MSSLLQAALDYAERGYAVFPLHNPLSDSTCSCRNPHCKSVGKHPRTRSGVLSATNKPETIRKWWAQWPDANIAVATGRKSGIIVIDVDADRGGEETLQQLEEQNCLASAGTGEGVLPLR
jgi:putative DNA primase/helicase